MQGNRLKDKNGRKKFRKLEQRSAASADSKHANTTDKKDKTTEKGEEVDTGRQRSPQPT